MDFNIFFNLFLLNYIAIITKTLQLLRTVILTISIVILVVFPPSDSAYAESTNISFEFITADQGLSQSGVSCIIQDSQGYMWFGTQDGLNKYDGYEFTVYKFNEFNPHSISDNFIASIYEDKSGTIWVGTDNGGLNKFDRDTEQFTHYNYDSDDPNSIGADRVLSIYEDRSGILWIGTDGGGLNKFNREAGQFKRFTHNPDLPNSLSSDTIFVIYEDEQGILWLGTDKGLNKFKRQTKNFTHYTYNSSDPNSISNDTVLSIYEDRFGNLWIGTSGGGLNKFDRENEFFVRYKHDPNDPHSLSHNTVNEIAEDKFGNLWLATSSWYGSSYGSGIDKFILDEEKFYHYTRNSWNSDGLNDNIAMSIYNRDSENLWIGTAFGGINKLNLNDKVFKNYQSKLDRANSLSDNHVLSIAEARSGIIWLGTADGGLNQFNRQTGKFLHYRHDTNEQNGLSSDNIWSIYEDREGILWIGTFGSGLSKFQHKTERFTHYVHDPSNPHSLSDNTVTSIYEDNFGVLWIGTFKGGLNKFDRETETFTHYVKKRSKADSLSDNSIWNIYEDSKNNLWIGTLSGGLNKFNRETEKFKQYKYDPSNSNSLSYDRIVSINEYPSGTLWIGTFGGGLNKFDIATETFTHYTEKDGLPNNSVVGILPDDEGNLWLSTSKGLSKFNPEAETFRNYDVGDGLQGNEFDGVKAYLKTEDGEMFFGGLNGFNSFYPDQIKDNPHIPPIVITDFRIFDKNVKLPIAISEAEEIKLSYRDDFFSFKFAALDYTNPEKNQYAYKLEGFDRDWIYSGTRRYASYTNLDPGVYTLRVKGSNNDGIWNEEGTSLRITITPPPWKTWWAYTLYAIAFVSSVLGYIRWRTAEQIKENGLLRASERKLTQFLEAIPLGVGVVDSVGKPAFFNQTALQVMGREAAPEAELEDYSQAYELYRAGTEELYPSENLPLVRALKGEKTAVDDIEIHRPDKVIPVEAWGTPIYDEHGEIVYAIAAFQDITERKLAEAALRSSLREKEALLQEVHHRVKNNLQIICSLLDLQSQYIPEERSREMFHSSQNRVRSMALIHEQLYQSDNLAVVNLEDYIRSLTNYLFYAYALEPENITLKLDLEEIDSDLDTAIPCGLILNELVSNALKHALNGNTQGKLWVELSSEDSQVHLTVGNDKSDLQEKINFDKNKSLGFQLVEVLVKQIEGQMEIEQTQATVFKLSFPNRLDENGLEPNPTQNP